MGTWRPIGHIALLQIQRSRLVTGTRPARRYDPTRLLEVDALALTSAGALGAVDGGWSVDVHHGGHPRNTRFQPGRALSIGFTAHYDLMAERFGDAKRGVGGENIIVTSDQRIMPEDIAGGVRITSEDGDVILDDPRIASPCHPFTKFLLGRPDANSNDVETDRDFLRRGMRGYVMRLDGVAKSAVVRVGDRVALTIAS